MKFNIHVDIQDEDGLDHCLEANGGWIKLLKTVWAVCIRYEGGGEVRIRKFYPEDEL